MAVLSFKPQSVTKQFISVLPERAQDIMTKRYGLGEKDEGMTLEAIGNIYGITRERVRQIENHSLNKIRESEAVEKHRERIDELKDVIHSLGVIVPEEDLLSHVSSQDEERNHIYFVLVLADPFNYHKENEHFTHRWHIDEVVAEAVHDALQKLHNELDEDELLSEREIMRRFIKHINEDVMPDHHLNRDEVIHRWLRISKKIDKNPLGEWGLASSPNVKVKGVRDYAYLVIRQHGSPMHFTEVTKQIKELFNKDAHVATTHNELIKDSRFVLVGRGLYALEEWGYMKGVVKDVIKQLIEKYGPMGRDEVVDKVLKERYVKPNTVMVNLQDSDTFKRLDDGRYALA